MHRNEGTGIGPLPDGVRPIQLPYSGPDADFSKLFADSEQIAQAVGKGSVPFSIGYDEFNIAAALTKAALRPT